MAPAKNLTMVLNAGSSSLKFKVFQALSNGHLESLASGLCERVGDTANSRMKVRWDGLGHADLMLGMEFLSCRGWVSTHFVIQTVMVT